MSNVSGTALADSILAKAAQPGVTAISFDVFDTLLVRPVYEPVDAFDIASSTAADVLFPGKYSFRDIRVVSERLARADSHSYGVIAEDISIYKIYDCIQKLTGISDAIKDSLIDHEIATELSLLKERKFVFNIYRKLLRLNKPIFAISDMCLPGSTVEQALRKSGYIRINKTYVSGEQGYSKGTGNLFKIVLKENGLRATQLLHVGDNPHGDFTAPTRMGITAVRIPSPKEMFEASKPVRSLFPDRIHDLEVGARHYIGVIQNCLYDLHDDRPSIRTSAFGNDPAYFGYVIFGPVILEYVKWVLKTSAARGINNIVFAARDGQIPIEIAKILRPVIPGEFKFHYLPMSRSICVLHDTKSPMDIVLSRHIAAMNPRISFVDLCRERLFIRDRNSPILKSLADACLVADMSSATSDIDLLLRRIAENWNIVAAHIEEQRVQLAEFYSGYFAGMERAAFVDVGYRGRSLRVLDELLPGRLTGLSFELFDEGLEVSERTNSVSFMGKVRNRRVNPTAYHTALIELAISEHDDGGFIGFTRDAEQKVVAVREQQDFADLNPLDTRRFQAGIIQFARDAVDMLGSHTGRLNVTVDALLQPMTKLKTKTEPEYASGFRPFSFRNNVTGHTVASTNFVR